RLVLTTSPPLSQEHTYVRDLEQDGGTDRNRPDSQPKFSATAGVKDREAAGVSRRPKAVLDSGRR
ncbi:hypothetical protein ABTX24_19140, partial [Nocardioides sp. NPDC127514]|uniref:hypothetical protein n=1 Tax=Nocardioides sp. NPDC127514 TaxID=3154243 RepID=UPI003320368B